MSRSALAKQESNEWRLQQDWDQMHGAAVDDDGDETVRGKALPMHGDSKYFNVNPLLARNILQHDYFRALRQLRTYHEVIDEVYYKCKHAEPWATGTAARTPSTLFCLLMKFFTMRLTKKQMDGLLRHQDSPFIRCAGFLYLRYVHPPAELWSWFEPYLCDMEPFNASADARAQTTISAYIVGLLTDIKYFDTLLPRIPVPIQREMQAALLQQEPRLARARANAALRDMWEADRQQRKSSATAGTLSSTSIADAGSGSGASAHGPLGHAARVRALYEDPENAEDWYDATITEVRPLDRFLVTFDPPYGNTEEVGLGDIEPVGMVMVRDKRGEHWTIAACHANQDWDRHRDHDDRDRDQDRRRDRDRGRDLMHGESSGQYDHRNLDFGSEKGGDDDFGRGRGSGVDQEGSGVCNGVDEFGREIGKSSARGVRDAGGGGHEQGRLHRESRGEYERAYGSGGSGSGSGGGVGSSHDNEKLTKEQAMALVMRREREGCAAAGKDYAARPSSLKGSLALKSTQRRRSRSRSRSRSRHRERGRERDWDRGRHRDWDRDRRNSKSNARYRSRSRSPVGYR